MSHDDMTTVVKNRPDDGVLQRHIHYTKPLSSWDNPEFPYHETKVPETKSVSMRVATLRGFTPLGLVTLITPGLDTRRR